MPSVEQIRFRAGDAMLAGTLTLPEGDGRHPWALLVPSWLPRGRDGGWDGEGHPGWFAANASEGGGLLERLAEALVERGVASLRYDPRGCAASPGRWEATNLFTRIDDARDAVGAMRSRKELDLRRTAIVGHGEGAAIAVSVAISDPAVGAVGLIGAPARSLRHTLRWGVAERGRRGVDRQHPAVAALDGAAEELIERAERREAAMRLRIGAEEVELDLSGWEQAIHTPVLALATMLHRNVVIAHGTLDAWSDVEESRLLTAILASAGNEPASIEIEATGHDLAEAGDDRIGSIADAIVERMEPRELPPVLVAIEEMGSER